MSPNIKNWLDDGGTIAIEELGNDKYIWHYSKDGITVPYVPTEINGVTQNVVQFPDEFIYQRGGFNGWFQLVKDDMIYLNIVVDITITNRRKKC